MKIELKDALKAAIEAAQTAGLVMRRNLALEKTVNEEQQYDIKLALDVECQRRIERVLAKRTRGIPVLGEEGESGEVEEELRWVVDPIDGTVNFSYGVPHACVSIALERRASDGEGEFETVVGAVYDPFVNELWTAIRGGPARLNGKVIRVSSRLQLAQSIVAVGFSKKRATLRRMLPFLNALVGRVRKIRITGSAALCLTYVASGRFDAYFEAGVRRWDIAAGGLILECAGGEFWRRPLTEPHSFELRANNGQLRRKLERFLPDNGKRK